MGGHRGKAATSTMHSHDPVRFHGHQPICWANRHPSFEPTNLRQPFHRPGTMRRSPHRSERTVLCRHIQLRPSPLEAGRHLGALVSPGVPCEARDQERNQCQRYGRVRCLARQEHTGACGCSDRFSIGRLAFIVVAVAEHSSRLTAPQIRTRLRASYRGTRMGMAEPT